ncbi:MAG: hypothetical protein RSE12_08555 [Fuscovulum sp.]|nr:MAG: hypothetical protein RSE12_08555 [Fuscovulum sp.]
MRPLLDASIKSMRCSPTFGMRLAGNLEGWLVRHGGKGHRLTIVFKADIERDVLQIALVAFGGQE